MSRWTTGEIDLISKLHGDEKNSSEIEASLSKAGYSRSAKSIRWKLRDLNVASDQYHDFWSLEEDDILRKYARTRTASAISATLQEQGFNRNPKSVKGRRKRLGLTMNRRQAQACISRSPSERNKRWWGSLTDKEKESFSSTIGEGVRTFWKSKSKEERRRIVRYSRKFFSRMSEGEEKDYRSSASRKDIT